MRTIIPGTERSSVEKSKGSIGFCELLKDLDAFTLVLVGLTQLLVALQWDCQDIAPSEKNKQKQFYSDTKKEHTIETQVVTDECRSISPAVPVSPY